MRNKATWPRAPSTLISQSNLAITYLEAGRAHEAVELLAEAREVCDRILGARHRTTRIIHGNIRRCAYGRDTLSLALASLGSLRPRHGC